MGCSKSSSKREVYSKTILPQKTRKILNRQSNFTPRATEKIRRKKISKLVKEKNHKDLPRNKWKRSGRSHNKD